jgi:DedD protein
MDQGLKERLIGAAVLVALGVWLIPWVLDGSEQQSETGSAALQLPVPEEPVPMRSQTIHLDAAHDAPGPAAVSAVADSSESSDAPQTATAAANPRPPENEPLQVPSQELRKPSAEPASPQPINAQMRAPGTAEAGWLVQLGSFSEEENARRLAQRVSTYGYKPDISNHRASGRVMYRVRVGPHESRQRADAAASALSAHGFVAQVVAAD